MHFQPPYKPPTYNPGEDEGSIVRRRSLYTFRKRSMYARWIEYPQPSYQSPNLDFNRSSGTASLLRTFEQVSNLLKTHELSKELAAGLATLKTKLATFDAEQEDAETQKRKSLVQLLRRADFLRRMLISEGIAEVVPPHEEDVWCTNEISSHRPEEEIVGNQKVDTQDLWRRLQGR